VISVKKWLLIIILVPSLTLATQWGSRTLAPGLNNSYSNYPASIRSNGAVYEITNYEIYYHPYNGSYSWGTGQKCTTPTLVGSITIDPSSNEAIVTDDNNKLRFATLSGNLNFSWGTILTAWDRSGHYPTSISCAWRGSGKWLYVAYEDGIVWGDSYPYDSPEVINVGGICLYIAVRFSGDYLIVQGWNGSNLDLYELTGFGSSWGSRTPISEVNTSDDERCPTQGAIGGYNILLWSAPGSVGGYDIYYSKGSSNSEISSTSLGRIKAMFQ